MGRLSVISLVLGCVFLAVGPSLLRPEPVSAADVRSVDAWIDISSVRPSVGCMIDVSVEVREVGQPLSNCIAGVPFSTTTSFTSAEVSM